MLTSRLFGGTFVTSWPCSRIAPRVGSSKPAIIRMVVVLPQPDGPSREKNSPSRMSRSTPATAVITSPWAWNSLTTPDSSIAGRAVSRAPRRVAAVLADAVLPDAVPAGGAPAPVSDPARAGTCLSVISGWYPSSRWGHSFRSRTQRDCGAKDATTSQRGTKRSSRVHVMTSTESVVRSVRYNRFSNTVTTIDNVPVAPAWSVTDAAHHVLDARVVLESVHRQVLAVTGVLEPPVRHLGDERDVGVDPDGAEVQLPGHPHGPAVVPGPDARGQAVLHPVCPAHRLLLGAEPLHRDDRAEDLLLDHLVVLPQTGDHRRGEAVAALPHPMAAGEDLGVARPAAQETLHPGQLDRVVQRAVVGVRHVQPAHRRAARLLGERVRQVVMYAGAGQHPGGGGAVLPGVEVAGAGDARGGGRDVGVVEDHDRRLAAELQVDPFQPVRGRPRH